MNNEFLKRTLITLGTCFSISIVIGTPFLLLLKSLAERGFKLSSTRNLPYAILVLGVFFATFNLAKNVIRGRVYENERKSFKEYSGEFLYLVLLFFIFSMLTPGILFWIKLF